MVSAPWLSGTLGPRYALFEQTRGSVISLLRILRTTRLIRVMRVGGNARQIFDAIVARTGIKAAYLDILRLFVSIMLAIHFLACLFHLLGLLELHGKIGSTTSQYGEDKAATWLEQYNIADTFATLDASEPRAGTYVERKVPKLTKYLWSVYWVRCYALLVACCGPTFG